MAFLLIWTSEGRVPVSPLILYDIKFVQRGFTERGTFEERVPCFGRGFLTVAHCFIGWSLSFI
jgi:hypothetical protein